MASRVSSTRFLTGLALNAVVARESDVLVRLEVARPLDPALTHRRLMAAGIVLHSGILDVSMYNVVPQDVDRFVGVGLGKRRRAIVGASLLFGDARRPRDEVGRVQIDLDAVGIDRLYKLQQHGGRLRAGLDAEVHAYFLGVLPNLLHCFVKNLASGGTGILGNDADVAGERRRAKIARMVEEMFGAGDLFRDRFGVAEIVQTAVCGRDHHAQVLHALLQFPNTGRRDPFRRVLPLPYGQLNAVSANLRRRLQPFRTGRTQADKPHANLDISHGNTFLPRLPAHFISSSS